MVKITVSISNAMSPKRDTALIFIQALNFVLDNEEMH